MYSIGDFIIRIKNATLARKETVSVQYSNLKEHVARLLQHGGYVNEVQHDQDKRVLNVSLAYKGKEPIITGLQIVSKPGLRVYKKSSELAHPRSIKRAIVSTPQGVMFGDEARDKKLGGEVIANIW